MTEIGQPHIYTDRVLRIDPGSVVVTVGSAGSGKTEWARRNFRGPQTLCMDQLRRLVAGSGTDFAASDEAFDVLLQILESRARRCLTTVLDGTFLRPVVRQRILEVCRRWDRPSVAVCFHIPAELAQYRNRTGSKPLSGRELRAQVGQVRDFIAAHSGGRNAEGWGRVVFFGDVDTDLLPVIRLSLPSPLPYAGPFDVIGDVHGCLEELDALFDKLGYAPPDAEGARVHPQGRRAVMVGDFADRGPSSAGVFRRVMAMHARGSALAVPGNHCVKLLHYLRGNHVDVRSGLGDTLRDLDRAGAEFRGRVRDFLERLPRSLILADGKLVVFHAALPRDRTGRDDEATEAQLIYGVVGTRGVAERALDWTATWTPGEDEPLAVYGHEPVPEPLRSYNTIDIDGGCVFGGYLAALRWPERELVYVPAREIYYENPKVDWRGAPGGENGNGEG
ncbi:MAG TPA: AAA family ATPase [Longimicrobiaceae bacterium]|jgi:protein phosphatase|nr:AAA family ATPase [Longimicrobiaceae bacterium]